MIFGILCIALPTGVIASNFNRLMEEAASKKQAQSKKITKQPTKEGSHSLMAPQQLPNATAEAGASQLPSESEEKQSGMPLICPHCAKEIGPNV
jgi:hypothetical protein